MEKNKLIKILTTIFVLIFLFLFILTIIYAKNIESFLGSNLEIYGAGLLFLIAFLIELIPNYLSPHLGAVNAYFLNINIQTTILLLIIGSIVGSLLGFEIGRKYREKLGGKILEKSRIKGVEEILNKKGRWGIMLAAISPLPYLPIVLGLLKFSRKNFYIFGIIPRSVGIFLATMIVYSF